MSRNLSEPARAAQAAQITGFRIMRKFEIAPGWWAQPREVGDTPSATVADSFCAEQNKVTMDLNRSKRIEFYADPIYADDTETATRPHDTASASASEQHTPADVYTYADAVADCPTHRAQHEQAVARYAEFQTANGASIARRDRIQLGLRTARATGDVCPLCEYFRCRCNGVQPQHPAGGAR